MPYAFAHGAGTEADPYQVWTADDLNGVRDYLLAYFKQMADIDLSSYADWTPIGTATTLDKTTLSFAGYYDGNYKTVSNLAINRASNDYIGLFGATHNANITNLGILLASVIGDDRVGILAGYIQSTVVTNCYTTGAAQGDSMIGGLVGVNHASGSISNCHSKATVIGSTFVGGLVGYCYSSFIDKCYSRGAVTSGNEYVGGLMGDLYEYPDITNSYYDSETSGCSDTGKGTPKTTTEMKQQSTYAGWDFDAIWAINSAINDGYPYLITEQSEIIVDDVIPSYPPASYIKLQFQSGDSALYDMGIYYADKTQFKVGTTGAKITGRNSVGKYLKDQTFDERHSYGKQSITALLTQILVAAGITQYYVAASDTNLGMNFMPNTQILSGIEEILKYAPTWITREEVSGKVVIGPPTDSEFTQPSKYTFTRNRDIFSREQVKDDQQIYGRVCVHTGDFTVAVYRGVASTLGWLPPAQKTFYQSVPDGTTSQEAAALADTLAQSMANSGELETFVCAFRPQIIPGDEAEILDSEGPTLLGVITQVKHDFGTTGFFTTITVDSGGRIGRPRFKDLVNLINNAAQLAQKL